MPLPLRSNAASDALTQLLGMTHSVGLRADGQATEVRLTLLHPPPLHPQTLLPHPHPSLRPPHHGTVSQKAPAVRDLH